MTFLPPPPPKYQLYYRKLVVKTLPQQSKQDAKNQLFFRFPHKSIETKRKGKHVKCGLARFSVTFMDGFMPPRLCFFFFLLSQEFMRFVAMKTQLIYHCFQNFYLKVVCCPLEVNSRTERKQYWPCLLAHYRKKLSSPKGFFLQTYRDLKLTSCNIKLHFHPNDN